MCIKEKKHYIAKLFATFHTSIHLFNTCARHDFLNSHMAIGRRRGHKRNLMGTSSNWYHFHSIAPTKRNIPATAGNHDIVMVKTPQ